MAYKKYTGRYNMGIVSIYMDKDNYNDVKLYATHNHISMSELINKFIEDIKRENQTEINTLKNK